MTARHERLRELMQGTYSQPLCKLGNLEFCSSWVRVPGQDVFCKTNVCSFNYSKFNICTGVCNGRAGIVRHVQKVRPSVLVRWYKILRSNNGRRRERPTVMLIMMMMQRTDVRFDLSSLCLEQARACCRVSKSSDLALSFMCSQGNLIESIRSDIWFAFGNSRKRLIESSNWVSWALGRTILLISDCACIATSATLLCQMLAGWLPGNKEYLASIYITTSKDAQ